MSELFLLSVDEHEIHCFKALDATVLPLDPGDRPRSSRSHPDNDTPHTHPLRVDYRIVDPH
jgi:hypothetical protein